jgi:hypothetical protein
MSSSTIDRPFATAKPRLSSGAKPPPAATVITPKDQDLPYEEREIRNRAARMLENEEMLLLLSRQRHEVKIHNPNLDTNCLGQEMRAIC